MNGLGKLRTTLYALAAFASLAFPTPLGAQELLAISGTGFRPSTLTVGETVTGQVSADGGTILVIERRWKSPDGRCIAWTIIRGGAFEIGPTPPERCLETATGDELSRALGGERMAQRVMWIDPGKADDPSQVSRLKTDLERLRKSSGRPAASDAGDTGLVVQPIPAVVMTPTGSGEVSPERRCHGLVQGRIAWDHAGNTRWAETNVERLCRGTKQAAEPARCFQRLMRGGIDWGGGDRWQWENAVDLCEGTSHADRTIACFEAVLAVGRTWQQAIRCCETR